MLGDHLDAVSAEHSSRTIFDLPFGIAKSLSKEEFDGPDILWAVKPPRDLHIASVGEGHCTHGKAHGRVRVLSAGSLLQSQWTTNLMLFIYKR
jgi:hypothetical protein